MKYLAILAVIVMFFGCSSQKEPGEQSKKGGEIDLLGAGATFPYPFYSKIFDIYSQANNVRINYQAIGSGGGIRQLTDKTIDFGATDAFMDEKELAQAGAPIVHVPMSLGAVVITYNLPEKPQVKLTGDLIDKIFEGKITNWNDKQIATVNPGLQLPKLPISVVHRSDGSGTTFIFSDYLGKVSQSWKKNVGTGKSLNWPVGIGGKGNQGVAGLIKQTPGSIGYVELVYSKSNNMPAALIQNNAGNFVEPTINSVSIAADTEIPQDMRVSITNTSAPLGYPISSFTWIVVFKDLNYRNMSEAKAKELVKLLGWMARDGQKYAPELFYAPLPTTLTGKIDAALKTITFNGKSLL